MDSLKLAFAGTPEFAVPFLQALHRSAHTVSAVFTQPDRRAGRGRELKASPVKQQALQLGLPVMQPETFRSGSACAALRTLGVDALIVVAYGLILPPEVLQTPRLGCFNAHASLLPRWRGAAPIQRAILAGDAHTGITIMRLEPGLDTGPMLATGRVPIEARDTGATLSVKLAALGAAMICDCVDAFSRAPPRETRQPEQGVTYAAKITKAEAQIDWGEDAASIERRVRAFDPWPVAQTTLKGVQLRIWQCEVVSQTDPHSQIGQVLHSGDRGIDVACARGILRLTRVQLPGRAAAPAREFLKSHVLNDVRLGAA